MRMESNYTVFMKLYTSVTVLIEYFPLFWDTFRSMYRVINKSTRYVGLFVV